MTTKNASSISTTVCFRSPAWKKRVAPWVRLTSPEATAANWLAMARSNPSETAIGSPTAETTIAWVTPETLVAKLLSSQLRLRASALSGGMGTPHGRLRQRWSRCVVGPWRDADPRHHAACRWPLGSWTAYCGPLSVVCWIRLEARVRRSLRPSSGAFTQVVDTSTIVVARSNKPTEREDDRGASRGWARRARAGPLGPGSGGQVTPPSTPASASPPTSRAAGGVVPDATTSGLGRGVADAVLGGTGGCGSAW